jgi:hypothetical protein
MASAGPFNAATQAGLQGAKNLASHSIFDDTALQQCGS